MKHYLVELYDLMKMIYSRKLAILLSLQNKKNSVAMQTIAEQATSQIQAFTQATAELDMSGFMAFDIASKMNQFHQRSILCISMTRASTIYIEDRE